MSREFSPPNKRMTVDDEKFIVERYQFGLSAKQILSLFSGKFKTAKSIYDVLKKYDVSSRDLSFYNSVDHFYFSKIDTPGKAYLLGLLIADGWVGTDSNEIGIQLQEKDKWLIEWIKKEWKTENNLVHCKAKEIKGKGDKVYLSQDLYRICVHSPQIKKDLSNFGVVPQKSFKTILPILDEYESFLFRGMLDGDGSIYLHSGKKHIGIRFVGSHYLMAQATLYLHTTLGLSYQHPMNKGNISLVEWTVPRDVEILGSYLYDDLSLSPFLLRKYEIFKNYISCP